MLETARRPAFARLTIVTLALIAMTTIFVSAKRLDASSPGCYDFVCTTNEACQQHACDLCAGDKRCAKVTP